MDEIHRYEGTINQFTGDGVMALWGANEAREDDPQRAIHAALDMQAQLAAFREARDLSLAMRVGIHTGPALLGGVAGLLVARWILDFLLSLISSGSHLPVGLDPRVLGFTLVVSVLTALLFGLVPARRASRVDVDPALKSQAVIAGEPLRGLSLRKGLVVSQVAALYPVWRAARMGVLEAIRSRE